MCHLASLLHLSLAASITHYKLQPGHNQVFLGLISALPSILNSITFPSQSICDSNDFYFIVFYCQFCFNCIHILHNAAYFNIRPYICNVGAILVYYFWSRFLVHIIDYVYCYCNWCIE